MSETKNDNISQNIVIKTVIRLMGTLFIITAVVAAALGTVNHITKDRIQAVKDEKIQAAMAQVLPQAGALEEISFRDDTGMVQALHTDGAGGYVVQVTPAGFGGEISMMVGLQDGSVSGICLVSHTETPGLGAVAAGKGSKSTAFRDQFTGLSGELAVTKDGGTIDALTGATVTSRAVTAGVNAALACVEKLG